MTRKASLPENRVCYAKLIHKKPFMIIISLSYHDKHRCICLVKLNNNKKWKSQSVSCNSCLFRKQIIPPQHTLFLTCHRWVFDTTVKKKQHKNNNKGCQTNINTTNHHLCLPQSLPDHCQIKTPPPSLALPHSGTATKLNLPLLHRNPLPYQKIAET